MEMRVAFRVGTWASTTRIDLSNDGITEMANNYLQSRRSLEDTFKDKFESDLRVSQG